MPVAELDAALILVLRALAIAGLVASPAIAGEADVVEASVVSAGDGTYRFTATIDHADEGWDHYANAFEIVTPNGTVLATRVLHHPHVDERPFTRSTGPVTVPAGTMLVRVRAVDSVHGSGGAEVELTLDQ